LTFAEVAISIPIKPAVIEVQAPIK